MTTISPAIIADQLIERASKTRRAELVADLHALADWLTHTDVPIQGSTRIEVLIHAEHLVGDDRAVGEIRRVAALIDAPVETDGGHTWTTRRFGRAGYRLLHIDPAHMARYYALQSYSGAVDPVVTS